MTMENPNLGENVFFLACHALLILSQIYNGIRYKTWGYLFGMFCGHVFEIVGFAARIRMHLGGDGFLTYIVTITIGPAFFSASIYLCLARIIAVYGQRYSRFSPRTYTITFMLFDFVALVLQAAGGSMLGSDDRDTLNVGIKVMKAGLAAHLAAISIFTVLATEIAFRVAYRQDRWNPKFSQLQQSGKFKAFLICLTIATFTILIRTAYRVAELSAGYHSRLAENETVFMLLEGSMIVIATTAMAITPPGVSFQGQWDEANFRLKKSEDSKDDTKHSYDMTEA
ncbi:RTA-like protein [Fusarium austroafricanum]|uniref:RTA-like protein n=1 Tax=Fusarium austroafricanum TaxID=2364996 RepID=A0A8H4KE25_9HYPO|nr:RTA-like protein [Fusarium austroafricanum]